MSHNKYILIISLLFLFKQTNAWYKILQPDEFYSIVKGDKKGANWYKGAIANLRKLLNYYIFVNVAKNPPQPSFDPHYHKKVNATEYLDKMESEITEDTNSYDFFRQFKKLVSSYADAHISYGLKGFNYSHYTFLCPIYLKLKTSEKGDVYMIGETNPSTTEYYFRNGSEVFKVMNKNKNVPIKSINGLTPFQFIQNFGDHFFDMKNKHATYTAHYHDYLIPNVRDYPLDKKDILNFKVIYSNGNEFQTDIAIAEIMKDDDKQKKYIEIVDDEKEEKNNNMFESKRNLKQNENEERKGIRWDYSYVQSGSTKFECRIDDENLVNVLHVKSYDVSDLKNAETVLEKCITLFDENTFPIIVIQDFNGGGREYLGNAMAEYLQPHMTFKFYASFLTGDYLDKYYNMKSIIYFDPKTCLIPSKKQFMSDYQVIDYGEGVINNVTKPYLRYGQNRTKWEEIKKSIVNKRKPTEIVVFTDSYSTSTTSLFCKSLIYSGGAIFVGYLGNPEEKEYPFDASQHFSSIIDWYELEKIDPELIKNLTNYNISFTQLCINSNHLNKDNLKEAEEYIVREVDERVDIYEGYNENLYSKFIQKGKEIIEKYKSKCNSKNKRLSLFSDKCKFENKYTHGGYACGENGEWDKNKCIKAYCDLGYYLNHETNKCEKDPCSSIR